MRRPTLKLLWIFSSFAPGPATARFAALAGRLGDDYEHVVGAMDGDFSAESELPAGLRWRRLETPAKKRGLAALGKLWSERKILLSERPHLLLTANAATLEWLALNRGPGAAPHIHFEDPEGAAPRFDDNAKRAWLRRRAFPGGARRFVAASRRAQRLFSELWSAAEDRVSLIRDGVDLPEAIAAPGAGGPVRLVGAGPLIREKRFDRLLRLTASLRERGRAVETVIMGEGPERAALETEIATLGLEGVARIEPAAPEASALTGHDLFVSAADEDLAPPELAMAMAAGLPVVATDVGDAREMLSAANGLFVRPLEDESALTAAAELLVSDGSLRAEIGRANREQAEAELSLDAMAARYDALIRELCAGAALLALPAPEATVGAAVETTKGAADEQEQRQEAPTPSRKLRPAPAAEILASETLTSESDRNPAAARKLNGAAGKTNGDARL